MTDLPADYVLPVDKPEGPTSHDIVQGARSALGLRRVGHTGTLDPFASGLLILCVGRATRISEYLIDLPKSYRAVALLGTSTDTDDRDGKVISVHECSGDLDRAAIEEVLQGFRGTLDQVPPQFSAKKVAGTAMYRRARRGQAVELEPCRVTVHELELLELDLPFVHLTVRCSSGTYVRSLARDIGGALGVGAHLTELRRTRIGDFDVEDSIPAADLSDEAKVRAAALSPLQALGHLESTEVGDAEVAALALGQPLPTGRPAQDAPLLVAREGKLIAIAEVGNGMLKPRKVFVT